MASWVGWILIAAGVQDELPNVSKGEVQPVLVYVQQLKEALDVLGNPLSKEAAAALGKATTLEAIQDVLDPLCLAGVHINPESRVKVAPGPAPRQLVEQGWRLFLLKVHNEAGTKAALRVQSPQSLEIKGTPADKVADRWLLQEQYTGRPLAKELSGIALEYRILQLYSRDAGKRAATFSVDAGQGTQDEGFRAELTLTFEAAAATPVTFSVKDEAGQPTTACFVIRDRQGHVTPAQGKRVAPDFFFQPQIYRADGETVKLPPGVYTIETTRGPEYLAQTRELTVGDKPVTAAFELKRWVDPAATGWWSGDHHIHAAGCAHYVKPTEGVHAPDMLRHCIGEDLKIGANLTWGPCFDYQKQFFTGQIDKVSQYPYLLRYDVEISGFGSHQSGHLVLLQLKDQIYPGGDSKDHWPTLCLNSLRWAKKQGAVVGPAHSGWGLKVPGTDLPNYAIPPFDSIGACEYIVDVTHLVPGPDNRPVPAVDFLSTVDTPYVWELNIWYHTLNVGFRTRISGETDFPCIYGERVGLGRAYVKLDGRLSYPAWCEGVRRGRAYASDGRSHLMDFSVNGVELGTGASEVRLEAPSAVTAKARVSALLGEKSDPSLRDRPYDQKPYWHVERARIGDSRTVKVELVVNGRPAAFKVVPADGTEQEVSFNVPIERSSWVAMRILPTSHTNPVWVTVGDKPVRASRRSAEWCLQSVDQCWSKKKSQIAPAEQKDAVEAYDHARTTYRALIQECDVD